MRGIAINEFGGPEQLQVMDLPDPLVGPDFVVIDIKAAGVNPDDYKIRAGGMATRYVHHFPVGIGWDAAGVVEAVGPAVRGFAPGDEVFAYCRKTDISDGTYAEKVAVPRTQVAHKPRGASFVEAAAVPLAALTAWECLTEALQLQPGETVLVTAAAGGVGHYAVQLARALGAQAIGTASAANHDFVRELGAVEVVDYASGGVADTVRASHPGGVDALLDVVGGEAQADARGALSEGARIVSIVDPTVKEAKGVEGFYVFVRPDAASLRELARRYDAGELRAEIAATFPLEQAAEAHRRIEEGHVRGKLVVTIE